MTLVPEPQAIAVIVGGDLVGDALMKLSFLRSLRATFPGAEIHWIASHHDTAFAGQLRDVSRTLIDRVHVRPDWLPTAAAPQTDAPAPRFDIVIDTRNRLKEARVTRAAVPHRLFIAQAGRFLLSSRRPWLFWRKHPHLADRLHQLVRLAAGRVPTTARNRLDIPADVLTAARRVLPDGPAYLGIAPGAGNMEKAWPRERFVALAQAQAAKGRTPVFLLGPQERDWRPELAAAVPDALFPLQDESGWGMPLGIPHTMAIGTRLAAAIANDSGTSHMLAAVDCPLVSLFGPTSADKLAPRVSRGAVLRAQDFGGAATAAIPVAAVDRAVDRLLAG